MALESAQRFRVRPLPHPPGIPKERRKRRSDRAGDALQMALDRAAERGSLDLVLITDERGLLVAHSCTAVDLSLLAAVLPLVGQGQAQARVRRGGVRRELTVRPMTLDDEVLYVGALGGQYGDRLREVASTAAATRRILA